MVNLTSAPLNAYSWTWGAIAIYGFMVKSIASYRRTRNPLAKIYAYVGLSFGTGLLFFGLPGFFTQNVHVLKDTYFLADLSVQISLQFAAWMLSFIGMKSFLKLKYMLAVTIPLSVVIMILKITSSHVSISHAQNLIVYTDQPILLILKSVIYILIAMPIAVLLIRQVPNQATLRAKFQSFIAGIIYAAVCIAAVSNNLFDKGSDTRDSSLSLIVVFTIFLLAQLPRPHLKH